MVIHEKMNNALVTAKKLSNKKELYKNKIE